ncbi:Katanin p80 WD40 repeat-containing subunit B1 [Phytophthora nicotianae]|uniref:Katanin p80 WD40 repeat-containing subunit B1 n=1 Tax=Phytophthora nicotianae TaxID=4792 RepID=A0A0W8DH19_PHYNI|nr:Katanin p80 WD40 repeat-containing subunit B1 [Phytophthora nicotianae]
MREKETKNIMSLSGHQSAVESIVFDPAEHKVVAGSQAGSIKVFDLEAGKVNRTLKGHMASTIAVDYHLYGDYVASGSRDTIVKVWDLRTKSCMQTFKGHSSEVTAVSFTPDGRWLTSGDQDGVIKIWDLTAGRLLHEFPDHGGAITSLEFNPEEFILVSSAADRTVRFWDVQEFALIGVTPVDNATTTSMSHTVTEPYSGKYLFCCSQEAIRVWSYETAIEQSEGLATVHESAVDPPSLPTEKHEKELRTSDFVMELRCGMDTCIKAFKARQKCVQQLLVHWEKGRLHDGLRYIGELPKGKREAILVDMLRITDLQSLGVDLEACVLLLPLIVEVLDSKFELYLSVGVDSGHKLFDAFSPIVKDARDSRQYRSRAINLAGEERAQRCNACDVYFQEMKQRMQHLADTCRYSSLQTKINTLSRALGDFYT